MNMEEYFLALETYVASRKLNLGDGESILSLLYEAYGDANRIDDDQIKHGIMAYNRTDQEKGKTTVLLPVSQWIIALGLHPGLVPSKQWIKVQESLERNKSVSPGTTKPCSPACCSAPAASECIPSYPSG